MDKEEVFTLNCINLKLLMRIGPTSHCCVFPEQKKILGHLTFLLHCQVSSFLLQTLTTTNVVFVGCLHD